MIHPAGFGRYLASLCPFIAEHELIPAPEEFESIGIVVPQIVGYELLPLAVDHLELP